MNNIYDVFPFPLYRDKVDSFDVIQQDFDRVFDDLHAQNKFQYIPGYETHMLSDSSFNTNLIEQYQLNHFKDAIHQHIIMYLATINSSALRAGMKYRILSSWMVLMGEGEYTQSHTHGLADIAGVYYYKATPDDGLLYFTNPNTHVQSSYCFAHLPTWVRFKPEAGNIMLFPGWLEHGTMPHRGSGVRSSVSFNVCFEREFA